jgi:hypothetical protein
MDSVEQNLLNIFTALLVAKAKQRQSLAEQLITHWKISSGELSKALKALSDKNRKKISRWILRTQQELRQIAPILSADARVPEINIGIRGPWASLGNDTQEGIPQMGYRMTKIHDVVDRLLPFLASYVKSIQLPPPANRELMGRELVRELIEISRHTIGCPDLTWVADTVNVNRSNLGLGWPTLDAEWVQRAVRAKKPKAKKPKGLFKSNWDPSELYSLFFNEKPESEPREEISAEEALQKACAWSTARDIGKSLKLKRDSRQGRRKKKRA